MNSGRPFLDFLLHFFRLLLEQAQGLWSITCQNDAIALGGQCRLNYFPKSRVIFGHQNGLCASCNFVDRRRCACLRHSGAGWKIDVEDSSSAKFAIHGHKTAMLLHNAIDARQPQPGPFACFLGSEKRFEDLVQGCRIHSHAGI